MHKHNVVFVLGPPGSGKGTICSKLQENQNFVHLSAGDLLRQETTREGSEVGPSIEKHLRLGTIVPVATTCQLLENAMNAAGDVRGFLIDGFPRNRDNLDGWNEQMAGKVNELFCLYISCPVEICIPRCLNRGQGRVDDNEKTLMNRVVTYNDKTLPVIEYYAEKAMLKEVKGDRPVDEVYADVDKIFAQI